jgi:hypothetical protein
MNPNQQTKPFSTETIMQPNLEQQNSMPIKTKIAIWLMIILGIPILILGLPALIMGLSENCFELAGLGCILGLEAVIGGILFLLPPIMLLKLRKKWLWFLVLIINSWPLLIGLISLRNLHFDIYSIEFSFDIIIISLLLLDRKNFWKVIR